jgi:hypothetical protein
MIKLKVNTSNLFDIFLSNKIKIKAKSYCLHCHYKFFCTSFGFDCFVNLGIIDLNDATKLLNNPISAIYTPFSF